MPQAGRLSRDRELSGTFSVGDHLKVSSIVAELPLYDRLVVPVPADERGDEWQRWVDLGWVDLGWTPQQQRSILNTEFERRGGSPEEVDQAAHLIQRQLLADRATFDLRAVVGLLREQGAGWEASDPAATVRRYASGRPMGGR